MTVFRVWAPNANAVTLVTREARTPMTRADNGWFQADAPAPADGADYAFALDGGEPLPDPRSPWQPTGVFGFSRTVDHAAFRWNDERWQAPPLGSAVIYELHIGTFTPEGTFDSAIERLDHLTELGATHVEIMPINEFPGSRGWGYDGVDLYAPSSAYGGPEGFKRLVDACHARGLAVLLDVVYNHLGPSGNHLSRFGPYFTDHYHTPWGQAVNLDEKGSDEPRRFICDNALMWLRDYHCDGLRLDAVHALLDSSATHLLEQLATEVAALETHLGRRLVIIAESDLNDPRLVRSREVGGYGLDAQWSDDYHHALHAALTGERDGYYSDFGSLADVVYALKNVFVYDGRYSAYRERTHGRPAIGLSGRHFLGYLQNHDQIGNRATGERSGALMSPERLKVAAALVCLAPFIPMLFQGEEWGASTPFQYFTDHQDANLGRAVTEGRRKEFASFGWDPQSVPDPQDVETFERSKLNWEELSQPSHAEMYDWYRQLLALRRTHVALTDGDRDRLVARYDEEARWLVIERGPLTIVCNLATTPQRIPLPHRSGAHKHILLLSSDPTARLETERADELTLAPDSVVALQVE